MEELSKAIYMLLSGKSPGADGMPTGVVKSGKAGLPEPLHKLLTKCWEECVVPKDMHNDNIIT
jgi:hypothetical protein